MSLKQAVRVGLIADDLTRYILQRLLVAADYDVVTVIDDKINNFPAQITNHPNIWVIAVSEHHAEEIIEELLSQENVPLLVIEEIPLQSDMSAYENWQQSLLSKLSAVIISDPKFTPDIAEVVWVLAASLGGPEAVKHFLSSLPKNLPLAMVYAQHTETQFDQQLAEMVSGQSDYAAHLVQGTQTLLSGQLLVVPVDSQLCFLAHGGVAKLDQPWQGVYQPAIDQVIADLARIYRERLGVIVFSGTCDDAAIGCRIVKACGGLVWAQSPDSCISPAMPQAAIDTGCVTFQGNPEQLAEALGLHMINHSAERLASGCKEAFQ